MMKIKYLIIRFWNCIIKRRPSVWDIDDYEPLEGEFFDGDDRHEIE